MMAQVVYPKDFNWGGVEFFSISDNVESSLELDIYDLGRYIHGDLDTFG